VARSSDHGNELPVSIKEGEFPDHLSNYKLLKKALHTKIIGRLKFLRLHAGYALRQCFSTGVRKLCLKI
jgi:hypothetical protein